MNIPPVYKSEYQLCLLVWEYEPIRSMEGCTKMAVKFSIDIAIKKLRENF